MLLNTFMCEKLRNSQPSENNVFIPLHLLHFLCCLFLSLFLSAFNPRTFEPTAESGQNYEEFRMPSLVALLGISFIYDCHYLFTVDPTQRTDLNNIRDAPNSLQLLTPIRCPASPSRRNCYVYFCVGLFRFSIANCSQFENINCIQHFAVICELRLKTNARN